MINNVLQFREETVSIRIAVTFVKEREFKVPKSVLTELKYANDDRERRKILAKHIGETIEQATLVPEDTFVYVDDVGNTTYIMTGEE